MNSQVIGYDDVRVATIQQLVATAIMPKITNDQNIIQYFVTGEQLKYWLRCFTSPLSSLNNYESLETIGDACLSSCIKDKVLVDNPYAEPDDLSRAVTYYGTNDFLHYNIMQKITFDIGQGPKKFYDYLEVDTKLIVDDYTMNKLQADLYESIMGTIKMTANMIFQGKLGYDFAYSWFVYTFRQANYDKLSINVGNSVTILNQVFSRFSEFGEKYRIKLEGKDHRFTVARQKRDVMGYKYHLSANDLRNLSQFATVGNIPESGVDLVTSTYVSPASYGLHHTETRGFVIGDVLETAKDNAARVALEFLAQNYSITPEWATEQKAKLEISMIFPNPVDRAQLETKKQRDGYTSVTARKLGKFSTESVSVMQLVGIRSGEPVLIASIAGSSSSITEMKSKLYKFYVTGDRSYLNM